MDILSCKKFCPVGRFVPWGVLSVGTYVWGATVLSVGRFVHWDVLSVGPYVRGPYICPKDVIPWDVLSTFCGVLSEGPFVWGPHSVGRFVSRILCLWT